MRPIYSIPVRGRRLRYNAVLREMIAETEVNVSDLIMPLFVCPGANVRKPILSMPGMYNFSVDEVVFKCKELFALGIKSVLLFGIPEHKDETGEVACQHTGIVQQALRAIKAELPQMLLVADVCNCEYTVHGHCGTIVDGDVDNDLTVTTLAEQSVSLAQAGADIIAPSDMMDGRVAAIRRHLDDNGFYKTPIMSYSAKYASAFYGPFREAAESTPQFGDRKTYQMDCRNAREAVHEMSLDVEEGADIIMIKPALSYLDIIAKAKELYNLPIAAYNVSGEYSMVKAAAEKGWIDGTRVMLEMLTSIKRAGADIIITYFAEEFALFNKQNKL